MNPNSLYERVSESRDINPANRIEPMPQPTTGKPTIRLPQGPSFQRGLAALGEGIHLFFTHPRWWLTALLPTFAILLLTILAGWGLYEGFGALWDFQGIWGYCAAFLISITIFILLFPTLYECLGGLFFDGLSVRVYREILGIQAKEPPFFTGLIRSIPAIGYACCTLLLAIPFVFILLIPWVGPVIWTLLFGYRFGISYLFSGGLVQGETVKQTLTWAKANRKTVAGFGIPAYAILTFFPFIGLLFIPGFVVAAILLRDTPQNKIQ